MINIGFTGTRRGMTISQHRVLARLMLTYHKSRDEVIFRHGMCVGADQQAHDLAKVFDFKCYGHPPDQGKYVGIFYNLDDISSPKPYLERNHNIVDLSTVLIATPKEFDEVTRSGTWATIRYAWSKNIHVVRIDPKGETYT